MYKLGLEKAEEPDIKLTTSVRESKGIPEKPISASLTRLNSLCGSQLWKIL